MLQEHLFLLCDTTTSSTRSDPAHTMSIPTLETHLGADN